MKLFIKEHILLIILQCMQFSFLFLLLYLSDFRNYLLLLYGLLVNIVLLAAYLVFQYYTRRHVYKRLSSKATNLKELLKTTDQAPIGVALDQLTRTQYQLFMEQLKQAEDAQKQHLTFMDRWVHQMKTPLSVIELTAQNLDEPESSSIREETERMKNGLHTVLNMARLRTIQEDFHIKPVVLADLLHEVNRENKRFYIRNQVYPHLHIDTPKLTVETDEKWLFFIVNQIIQNAVKYSAKKSNRIDISLKKLGKRAVMEITDYGVGIPSQDKKRVFQAFFTGDNGRTFRESTGMGLYLTKEVADYLEHQIEMESTEGSGTTFRILFTPTQTIT
ncbi:sensor histidine kinase [Virgibacillus halodenitrificans]|uniref:sensor histidine kinase n=1 Tax=Virgibacillus halodenitrificans TaxID=1482 RepID=UPI0013688093|nr:sensor histidine kinase [Virgibacillus halodenitrificans]MYL45581.1 sensor histidine kinase [Virgibacillus halodenitrificans]